jgi:hypothetical protein
MTSFGRRGWNEERPLPVAFAQTDAFALGVLSKTVPSGSSPTTFRPREVAEPELGTFPVGPREEAVVVLGSPTSSCLAC